MTVPMMIIKNIDLVITETGVLEKEKVLKLRIKKNKKDKKKLNLWLKILFLLGINWKITIQEQILPIW